MLNSVVPLTTFHVGTTQTLNSMPLMLSLTFFSQICAWYLLWCFHRHPGRCHWGSPSTPPEGPSGFPANDSLSWTTSRRHPIFVSSSLLSEGSSHNGFHCLRLAFLRQETRTAEFLFYKYFLSCFSLLFHLSQNLIWKLKTSQGKSRYVFKSFKTCKLLFVGV